MQPLQLVVRLARRLQTAWAARAAPPPDPERAWHAIETRLAQAHQARHRVRLAAAKGLVLILPHLRSELAAAIDDLARYADQLRVEYTPTWVRVPDLSDWMAEVGQLEDEFAGVKVRWADRVLRVVTEPITLSGVELGPFAVELVWDRIGRSSGARCFTLLALDPRPAAGKARVVHPHVEDGWLCAGDAAEALDAAVRDGRLADAFQLVRSVLTTYNPRSAYAPLDAWDGTSCSECGRVVVQDDRFSCEACDADLCDECSGSCSVCSATRCGECLDRCPVCEDRCCSGCLTPTASDRAVCPACRATCAGCRAAVPTDELDEETRLCPDCLETSDDVVTTDPQPSPEVPEPCDETSPAHGG